MKIKSPEECLADRLGGSPNDFKSKLFGIYMVYAVEDYHRQFEQQKGQCDNCHQPIQTYCDECLMKL